VTGVDLFFAVFLSIVGFGILGWLLWELYKITKDNDDDDNYPRGGTGGGGFDANTALAIRTAVLGA
jgi:hypothetical protein